MTTGILTTNGPAIQHRGVTVQLPAARTVAAIDAGEIVQCEGCGRYACECEADPDPHGDLSAFSGEQIPY